MKPEQIQDLVADYYIKSRRYRIAVLALLTVVFILTAIGMVWFSVVQKQIQKTQVQNQKNSLAIADYLDCVGHITKPVAQRTIADYDKCTDQMRNTIKANK